MFKCVGPTGVNRDRRTPMAAVVGDAGSRRGTEVTFLPSPCIFSSVEFDKAIVEHRLNELALLNPSVRFILHEKRMQSDLTPVVHPAEARVSG